jgi:hypothetical protein
MKKHGNGRRADRDLEIPKLGPEFFANAVVGKYYGKMAAKTNVVRIAPDLTKTFPNEASVNQALREVLRFRTALSQITQPKAKRRKSA